MSRFYVRPEDVKGDEIRIAKEEAHHILDVMRMTAGDNIIAFDGTGKEYIGSILVTSKYGLKIKIERVNNIEKKNKISITLAQSLPKRAKMDFIVEKATELGVHEIVPLITERTIVQLGDKGLKKQSHWQNIAVSASKQCGRLDVPRIRSAMEFNEVLKEAKNYDIAMMACLNEDTKPLREVISNFKERKILIMVGPEGDFSLREIHSAKSSGIKLVSLGHLVLRVDTAAIFILSVLRYTDEHR